MKRNPTQLTANLDIYIVVIVATNFEDDMTTLTPAYGRDYTNAKDAEASWIKGEDWLIADMSHPGDGRYCSIRDIDALDGVMLRYKGSTKLVVL